MLCGFVAAMCNLSLATAVAEQNVRVELFYAGAWNDCTDSVYHRDQIETIRGRGPGADLTPGSASLTLRNMDGRFNPRNAASELYGLIGRNTPIRISMRPGNSSGALADAADDFTPDASNSWGSPDVGPDWVEFGAGGSVLTSDFQRTGGAGTHYVPAANAYRACRLDGLLITDCTQLLEGVRCPVPTGAPLEPGNLIFRGTEGSTYVLARVEISTAGAVTCRVYSADDTLLGSALVSGLTHTGTGMPLNVRARAVGRDVFVRVWDAAGAEPSIWHLRATDDTAAPAAGFTGIRSGRANANTNTANPQFSYDAYTVTVEDPVFVGEVSSWSPRRAIKGDAWTEVSAGGILRRIGQGDDPLDSAARKALATADISLGDLWAYWPMEDGEHALEAASLVDGVAPLRPVGTSQFTAPGSGGAIPPAGLPKFAAGTGPAGSGRLVSLTEGGRLDGQVHSTATGALQQHWEAHWTMTHENGAADAVAGSEPLLMVTEGTAARWLIDVTDTAVTVFISDVDDVTIDSLSAPVNHYDGTAHVYNVFAFNTAGGDVQAGLWIDGVHADSVTIAGETVGPVRSVTVNPIEERGDHMASSFGHLAIYRGLLSAAETVAIADAMHGHPGETAGRRMERLCTENSVPFTSAGDLDATMPMAAQRIASLGEHLSECERTDAGLVVEPSGFLGLHYRTRDDLYNRTAGLELDFAAGDVAPALEPVVDDLGVFNDVTASRPDGASARAVLTSGPMNVSVPADDPDGVGRYKTDVDVNPERVEDLTDLAWWYLASGTVDETRYPRVTVDLDAVPALTDGASALGPGDVLEVANLEPETVRLMVSSVAQTIGTHRRVVEFAGAPAAPYTVGVYNASSSRYDSSVSTTAADFDAGMDTSLSVAVETSRKLWVTGSTAPQFPFNIRVAGVVLEVTGISGATSPQTFTVTAAPVNGISKTIAAGAQVRLAAPVRYGL